MQGIFRAFGAVILATLIAAAPARAGLLFDLSISGSSPAGSISGTGSIQFSSLFGNTLADVVAFSFVVDASDSGFSIPADAVFDKTGITAINWSVDGNWVLSLDLVADGILGSSSFACIVLSNTPASNQCQAAPTAPILNTTISGTSTLSGSTGKVLTGELSFVAQHLPTTDLPEPPTALLFAMAALLLFRRRATA
ncbi:MAG: hypothetical protein MI755_10645 [Sphingomonadales bacterium]|nr:hypothetical protein [Sphingomonadales bacterium]